MSSLALKRALGVSYPTVWRMHHKLMQAMTESETLYTLGGQVQVDDAYLGGELAGGKSGRGSENKVPFVAAVSLDDQGHPLRIKLTVFPGFTRKAIVDWAKTQLGPGCSVLSNGFAGFTGVTEAGCHHQASVAAGQKRRELPDFLWINTILGNLKTSLSGAYHAFDFAALRYLAAFAYRFNRRFRLESLSMRVLAAALETGPRPEPRLRMAEESC